MKVLKDSLESTNTHYQEEVERRERLEMDLNKLREMNVKLEADLANHVSTKPTLCSHSEKQNAFHENNWRTGLEVHKTLTTHMNE